MFSHKLAVTILAAGTISAFGWTAARAQAAPLKPPAEGTVYTVHSPATNGCPQLDWHVVVGENSTLSGMVSTDHMKSIWMMTGSFTDDRKFHMNGKEQGGAQRSGGVDGMIQPNGSLVATMRDISGPSACNNVTLYIPWFRNGNAYDPANGVGGAGGAG